MTGLPRAEAFEAPSSWLTRASLSQGIRPKDLLAFMGFARDVRRRADPNLLLMSAAGRRVLDSAGILATMPVARKVFDTLKSVDPKGAVLLRDPHGQPCSRYCPECLRDQRMPHFELHWRFEPWRHCPLHQCLMEGRCAHCRQPVLLPFDMVNGGKAGVAHLRDCQHCARPLHAVTPVRLEGLGMTELDQVRLRNGRALMAALYHGRLRVQDGTWMKTSRSEKYIKAMTFWKPGGWYSPDDVRASAAVRIL
ncbi:TniQ family protein [Variovorax sp.]|uniref:TniQ family protein n=1 Tax=Variovorax sp. TaxID=1871043 RepID=UPI003BA96AD5